MNILFVQDYNVFAFPGGAERNDLRIVHEGIRRGHSITMNPDDEWDLAVISNCVTIERETMEAIYSKGPYIFFFHDYIFCKWRLFYPMIEKCKICTHAKKWKERFMKARLLIFLSPLHRDAHYFAMPELKEIPALLIPSTIDPDKFMEPKRIIPNRALIINGLLPFKGGKLLMKYIENCKELSIRIISPNPLQFRFPENVEYLGERLPYHAVHEEFNTAEYYIELPETPQPFNRTFVEAKLSGCKIITNKLAGALSYEWFNDLPLLRENLRRAPAQFWEGVE